MVRTEAHAELWERFHAARTEENRNALATAYYPWLSRLAAKQRAKLPPQANVEIDDLVSYGWPGLLQAIDAFDPGRGFYFSTFAPRRIFGAMLDGLRQEDWVPRLERRKIREGEATEIQVKRFPFLLRNDGDEFQAFGEAISRPSLESERQESLDLLRVACRGLRKIERCAVILYYFCHLTMREAASNLQLSESRISQMLTAVTKHWAQLYADGATESRRRLRFDAQEPVAIPKRIVTPRPRPLVPVAPEIVSPAPAVFRPRVFSPDDFFRRCDVLPESNLPGLLDAFAEVPVERIKEEIAKKDRELRLLRALLEVSAGGPQAEGETVPGSGGGFAAFDSSPLDGADQTPVRETAADRHLRRVVQYLAKAGPSRPSAIEKALGMAAPTMYAALRNKQICKRSDGLYELAVA